MAGVSTACGLLLADGRLISLLQPPLSSSSRTRTSPLAPRRQQGRRQLRRAGPAVFFPRPPAAPLSSSFLFRGAGLARFSPSPLLPVKHPRQTPPPTTPPTHHHFTTTTISTCPWQGGRRAPLCVIPPHPDPPVPLLSAAPRARARCPPRGFIPHQRTALLFSPSPLHTPSHFFRPPSPRPPLMCARRRARSTGRGADTHRGGGGDPAGPSAKRMCAALAAQPPPSSLCRPHLVLPLCLSVFRRFRRRCAVVARALFSPPRLLSFSFLLSLIRLARAPVCVSLPPLSLSHASPSAFCICAHASLSSFFPRTGSPHTTNILI